MIFHSQLAIEDQTIIISCKCSTFLHKDGDCVRSLELSGENTACSILQSGRQLWRKPASILKRATIRRSEEHSTKRKPWLRMWPSEKAQLRHTASLHRRSTNHCGSSQHAAMHLDGVVARGYDGAEAKALAAQTAWWDKEFAGASHAAHAESIWPSAPIARLRQPATTSRATDTETAASLESNSGDGSRAALAATVPGSAAAAPACSWLASVVDADLATTAVCCPNCAVGSSTVTARVLSVSLHRGEAGPERPQSMPTSPGATWKAASTAATSACSAGTSVAAPLTTAPKGTPRSSSGSENCEPRRRGGCGRPGRNCAAPKGKPQDKSLRCCCESAPSKSPPSPSLPSASVTRMGRRVVVSGAPACVPRRALSTSVKGPARRKAGMATATPLPLPPAQPSTAPPVRGYSSPEPSAADIGLIPMPPTAEAPADEAGSGSATEMLTRTSAHVAATDHRSCSELPAEARVPGPGALIDSAGGATVGDGDIVELLV